MTQSIERVLSDARPPSHGPRCTVELLARSANPRVRHRGAVLAAAVLGLQLLGQAAPMSARGACVPDPPTADGDTITCTGTDSTGFDGSGFDDLTVNVEPGAILDDSDPGLDSAILINERSTVSVSANATVEVTEDDGFGIRGGNDNVITVNGLIRVDADDARGVSVDSRTAATETGSITTGASGSLVQVLGNRSIGLAAGDNLTVNNSGTIVTTGAANRAISVGDRTDLTFASSVQNVGTIEVGGAGSIGIRAGDGWYSNNINASGAGLATPTGAAISVGSSGTIDVTGAGAFGIRLGDDANSSGIHNSFATHAGTIDVMGNDAIGVSLGGNDLLTDPAESMQIVTDLLETGNITSVPVFSFVTSGSIVGGANSGPLIEFRNFAAGENRIGIDIDASVTADLTNQGMNDRAIAIQGSDGREFILNFGEIQGDILLEGGDDRFAQRAGAVLNGTLDGGDGFDELVLAASSGSASTFDVSNLAAFELIRVGGGAGWTLDNTAGFTGLTRVEPQGRLVVDAPTTLGGALEVDAEGTIAVALDGVSPPLTVAGNASLAGTLEVDPADSLAPSATPYRVLQAGTTNGEFDQINVIGASGTQLFTPEYDALGLTLLYEILPLSTLARGRNNQAILDHVIEIGNSGGGSADVLDFYDQLDELTTAEANSSLNAFSPEAYDAQTQIVVDAGLRVANLLLDRPRECSPGKLDPWTAAKAPLPCHDRSWAPWLAAVGGFRSREKFAGHPRYDASLGGLVVGIDSNPIEGLDLTFAIGSQRGTVNVAGAGDSTVTLTDVAGHASWTQGPVRAQTVLSWGHGFHDDKRRIQYVSDPDGGTTNVRADTDHDSDRITLAGEIGYAIEAGPILVEPLVGLDWTWISQRSFDESDAGGFSLKVKDRSDDVGSVSAGFRASTIYHHTRYVARQLIWMDGIWRPQIDLRWRQTFTGNERDIDARFQGAPGSVPDFTIKGKEDDGGLEVGAGLSFVPSHANRLQFDLRYETFLASHTVEQDLTARVLISF